MQYFTHIYTGNGKGKTTAALGLALRAAGRGKHTFIGQFMKGSEYGELESLKNIAEITIQQLGWPDCIHKQEVTPLHIERTLQGLETCAKEAASGNFKLIVLDEILVAIAYGLIEETKVIDFLQTFKGRLEIVLTGRQASPSIMKHADLITEMTCVRHYYNDKGITSRKGIEF